VLTGENNHWFLAWAEFGPIHTIRHLSVPSPFSNNLSGVIKRRCSY